MIWQKEQKHKPRSNKQYGRVFALLPIITSSKEVIWLEWVAWRCFTGQEHHKHSILPCTFSDFFPIEAAKRNFPEV